jgi:AcrR family transcriptional regulator
MGAAMPETFQRARQPKQKQQRRQEILAAAAELLDQQMSAKPGGSLEGLSLSAIARSAKLAKSNIYRYFESREQILLALLIEQENAAVSAIEQKLVPLRGTNQVEDVASVLAEVLASHPKLCLLISVVANVLEHNLSHDSIVEFKEALLHVSIRIGNALQAALPALPHQRTFALLRYLHALISGLWPMGHPAPLADEVLKNQRFAAFRSDFTHDLAGALGATLAGLVDRQ